MAHVVFVQGRCAGLAEQPLALIDDVIQLAQNLLHSLLVATLVGHNNGADLRQRPQHFQVAPAQIKNVRVEFGGGVGGGKTYDQRTDKGGFAPTRRAEQHHLSFGHIDD